MNTILHKKLYVLTLVLLCTSVSFSQNKNKKVEKANKEFEKFAYIDARKIYLQIVEDGVKSAQIFEKLGDTYYWNSDYDNAAKWYSRLVNEYSASEIGDPIYYYRAAQSLKSINRSDESKDLMRKYADNGGDQSIISAQNPRFLDYYLELEKAGINTSYSDFGPSYDGDKIVFASSSTKSEGSKNFSWNEQPYLDLFIADVDEEGNLSNAESLSGDVNTPYHESSAAFTKDGKYVYFTRNNLIDGKVGKDENKTIRLKLYRATRSGDNFWTDIVELPFNSKKYSVAHPTLSNDEKRLYFSSDMPGTIGMSDLWYVDILGDNTYDSPVNLGPSINTAVRESFPFISEDNNLYFSSDGRGGLGGYDIYVAKLDENGNIGEISNLGEPANSNQDDFGFIFKESKKIGYMSSNREGTRGSIDDEIYVVRKKCENIIKGIVTDKYTNEIIAGATVILLDANNTQLASTISAEDGSYTIEGYAVCDTQYSVRGLKESYEPYEKVIRTRPKIGAVDVLLQLTPPCPPNDLGCRLDLQPIYFDFDRYNIRPDAAVELAKILAALREYPEMIIHIESHTDSRGSDKYNEILSEKRAQSTLKWLVSKGIDKSRLSAKGYGENRHVNQCSNGVECTEEEHQLNRRSMFIIQN